MLRSIKEIIGYRIEAGDGELGRAKDFFFDDRTWTIRYLIVATGDWLEDRQVLISPQSVREPSWTRRVLPVALTKEQVAGSPAVETDLPVSRVEEQRLAEYYSWQPYWQWPMPLGASLTPVAAPVMVAEREESEKPIAGDPNLRSVKDLTGYRIHAADGEVGHVADFLAQTEPWAIRYMIVDTRNWLPGRKVLVSPAWATRVDWREKRVYIDLTREEIRGSHPFDPSTPINREYELRLYDYYGRPKYWEAPAEPAGKEEPAKETGAVTAEKEEGVKEEAENEEETVKEW